MSRNKPLVLKKQTIEISFVVYFPIYVLSILIRTSSFTVNTRLLRNTTSSSLGRITKPIQLTALQNAVGTHKDSSSMS